MSQSKPTTVIAFINQKGGCGKNSNCFHLAGYFASCGWKTLLIDADPQGSLSQGFFGSAKIESLSANRTLAALFADELIPPPPERLPVLTAIGDVSTVRANHFLAQYNTPQPELSGLRQQALRGFLSELEPMGLFDVVLIDCPPNLYQCSWNALVAADFVVIPVPPEDFGTQGLRMVHQAIEHARLLNPRLELLGHLICRCDRRLALHRAYQQKLRELYGKTVFDTVVPEASAFKVALACRQPVTQFSPRSRAALTMADLGSEMLRRVDRCIRHQKVA